MYYYRFAFFVLMALWVGAVQRGGAQTLADALDTPGTEWESGIVDGIGMGVWLPQTAETNDGEDAVSCTPETPGAFKVATVLKVSGPKRITFFWRLDTGAPVDLLRLRRDEIDMVFAEPDMGWHGGTALIPTGDYSIFFKVQQFVEGMSPTAYVDQVSITEPVPTDNALIMDQPAELSLIDAGASVTLSATAFGALPMTFQWLHDGVAVPGATNLSLTLSNTVAEDGGVYQVVAVSPTGVPSTSANATVTVMDGAVGALADAVDNFGLVFEQGSAPWGRQVLVSHDGVDSALSRFPPPGGVSEFSASITGPTKLRFFLHYNLDLVRSSFEVLDGDEVRYRSEGFSPGFREVLLGLGPGSHEVRWRFDRGTSNDESQQVFVDEIELLPSTEGAPLFSLNPSPILDLYPGDDLMLSGMAIGEGPLTYQWQKGGVDLPGETNETLTIVGASPSVDGIYGCVASNGQGTGDSLQSDVLFHVDPASELPTALDIAMFGVSVTTAGDAAWLPQRSEVLTGGLAARSGSIGDGQVSDLSIPVGGPGRVSFSWKVSSEAGGDVLSFSVGGAEAARVSGKTGWERFDAEIAPGPFTLTWRYQKDGANSDGQDTGYLDQMTFLPSGGQSAPVFSEEPLSQVVLEGEELELSVVLAPAQTFPITWQWSKDGAPIPGAVSSVFSVAAATLADAGSYVVSATNPLGVTVSQAAEVEVELDADLRASIVGGTGQVRVSWVAGGEVYALESTGSLVAPVNWTVVEEVPVLVEGRFVVSVPGSGERYFRLVLAGE